MLQSEGCREVWGLNRGCGGIQRESDCVRQVEDAQAADEQRGVEGRMGGGGEGEVEESEGETLQETTAFLVNISSTFAKTQ